MRQWRPLKHFCVGLPQYGLNIPADNYVGEGGLRFIRTTDVTPNGGLTTAETGVFVEEDAVGREYDLQNGDLLLSRSGSLGRCMLYRDAYGPATFAGYLVRFRPGSDACPRYLAYCAESLLFQQTVAAEAVSSTISNFNAERYAGLRLPWWPPETQRTIADFLDAEIARIDALIAKKRQLVACVVARAEAQMERLVLGVGGDEPGVARSRWFSTVPSNWSETVLRHVQCEVQTGPFGSQLHANDYIQGGWPVVNPTNLVGGKIVSNGSMTISTSKREELARHVLRPGDIVFGRRGEMGRAGLVDQEQAGWLCGTGSLRFRLRGSSLLPEYLKALVETRALREYFLLTSVGSTMDNLNSNIILSAPVLVPPIAAQRDIVSRIRAIRRHADSVAGQISSQMTLLRERRQALITAAVTGEMEIPGVAA